jgi:hypothetical protein
MSRAITLLVIVSLALTPLLALTESIAAARPKRDRGPITIETGLLPGATTQRGKPGRLSVKDRYIVVLKDAAGDPNGLPLGSLLTAWCRPTPTATSSRGSRPRSRRAGLRR